MSKRKASPVSEGREPPFEVFCTKGRAWHMAPEQLAAMGTRIDPEPYFGPPLKRHEFVSFGVIEVGSSSNNLEAMQIWPPLQPQQSVHSEDGQPQEPQFSFNVNSNLDQEEGNRTYETLTEAGIAPENPDPALSGEQQEVVDLILAGHNVFYTGSAGCGKSTILRAFVNQLKGLNKNVRICAPTNLTALNINGITLWSFAGWMPDHLRKPLAELEKAASGKKVWKRMNATDVLVIDEISMCENLFFERLNATMKAARGNRRAFGGVQLVVTGDFCQLQPVKPFQYCIGCGEALVSDNHWRPTFYECENPKCMRETYYDCDKWAFRSDAWAECNFKQIILTELHRQEDKMFISILQRIRIDNTILAPHRKALLEHTCNTDGAIEIFSTRKEVERVNTREIDRLQSSPSMFRCRDFFNFKDHHRTSNPELVYKNNKDDDGTLYALKEHRFDKQVRLKKGMRVVLQANLNPTAGIVNGTQGTVVGFQKYNDDHQSLGEWNGKSVDNVSLPTFDGPHAGYRKEEVRRYARQNGSQPWPVVEFDNGVTMIVFADCMINEYGDMEPYSMLSRTQIPLAAGYAITVHKAQGMTLEKMKVDLSKAFEPSQIYVALSRAKSLNGLQVTALPETDLGGPNAEVKAFLEECKHEQ